MFRKIALVGIAAASFGTLTNTVRASSDVETVDIPIPKAVVVTAFNAAFASTKVHVHNMGSKHGSGSGITWHNDASFVLLPNGQKVKFPVSEEVFKVTKWRKLKYYIDDLNTQSIQATVSGSQINTDLRFESQGEEVKARCIRRRLGKWKECTLDMERDIQIDSAILGISLKPVAYNGSIAYANVSKEQDVVFKYDLKIANRLCDTFKGICGSIEDKIKSKLTPAIKSTAATSLNQASVKAKVAAAVKNAAPFRALVDPSWKVTQVTSSGNNFIVRVERPVTIDESSVAKLSLKSVQPNITTICPATVKLAATIKMKDTVKGTGFLRYEDGETSGSFNWSAQKGQTVTSNIERKFHGQPGVPKDGSAVMKVKWQGSDGKTYSKDSNKTSFTVTCTSHASGELTR